MSLWDDYKNGLASDHAKFKEKARKWIAEQGDLADLISGREDHDAELTRLREENERLNQLILYWEEETADAKRVRDGWIDQAEAAEAKLARVVEALDYYASDPEDVQVCTDCGSETDGTLLAHELRAWL